MRHVILSVETTRNNNNDVKDLARRCKSRCPEAYTELVDGYSKRFYGYFYSLTRKKELSEDLLSELYLKILKSIDSCNEDKFEAWMFKIASNIYYDYLRKKLRDAQLLDGVSNEIVKKQSQTPEKSSPQWDLLHQGLEKLDVQTRELIMLKYFSGMSFKDIAKLNRKPIGTVLSKIHRGIGRLRELINFDNLMQ